MLTKRDRIVLDTILPSKAHPTLPLGIFDAGFDEWYQDFQKNAVFPMRIGFWAALFIAVWIAPLLIFRIPPISLYERPTRERILLALYNSRFYGLRQMFLLLKANLSFCYGANMQVRDAIGFPRQHDDARSAGTPTSQQA
jgi:hypothetical protein